MKLCVSVMTYRAKRLVGEIFSCRLASVLRFKSRQVQTFTLGVKGFTLVELAVVLVIIATLYMSVLKVKSVVSSVKVRQMVNMYRELRTAITVYKEKYGYLPGDDPYADVHLGLAATTPKHIGDGNGTYNSLTLYEYLYAPEHLSKAGLINGVFSGSLLGAIPAGFPVDKLSHPFNDHTLIGYLAIPGGDLKKGNSIRFDNIPLDAAQAFDTQLDDGKYNSGFIRGIDLNLSGFVITLRDYTVSGPAVKRFCVVCFFE